MATTTKYPSPESRFSIAEVPDQISRIFFGTGSKPEPVGYTSSYGAPTLQPYPSNTGYQYNPSVQQVGPQITPLTQELNMTLQLGQVALVTFIIMAIVIILFILTVSCLFCTGHIGRSDRHVQLQQSGYKHAYDEDYEKPQDWNQTSGGDRDGGVLSRSTGIENLNLEPEISVSNSETSCSTVSSDGIRQHQDQQYQPQLHQQTQPNQTYRELQRSNQQDQTDHRPSWASSVSNGDSQPVRVNSYEMSQPRQLPAVPQLSPGLMTDRSLPYYEVPSSRIQVGGGGIPKDKNKNYSQTQQPIRNSAYSSRSDESHVQESSDNQGRFI